MAAWKGLAMTFTLVAVTMIVVAVFNYGVRLASRRGWAPKPMIRMLTRVGGLLGILPCIGVYLLISHGQIFPSSQPYTPVPYTSPPSPSSSPPHPIPQQKITKLLDKVRTDMNAGMYSQKYSSTDSDRATQTLSDDATTLGLWVVEPEPDEDSYIPPLGYSEVTTIPDDQNPESTADVWCVHVPTDGETATAYKSWHKDCYDVVPPTDTTPAG